MLIMFECTVVGQRLRTLKELRSLQTPKQRLSVYRWGWGWGIERVWGLFGEAGIRMVVCHQNSSKAAQQAKPASTNTQKIETRHRFNHGCAPPSHRVASKLCDTTTAHA